MNDTQNIMTITLTSPFGNVTVDCAGGRIHELVLRGRSILGTYPRIDGKEGATHVCVPNFAAEGTSTYALPFHGPARGLKWEVREQTAQALTITCEIPPSSAYPAPLHVVQPLSIGASFVHVVSVTNMGAQAVPVNIGIHNYWDTPHGWRGTQVNGADVSHAIATNGSINAEPQNTIIFPGQTPMLMQTQSAQHLVTWTGVKNGAFDEAYACIEPVHCYDPSFFGSPVSMLMPTDTRTIRQEISVVDSA